MTKRVCLVLVAIAVAIPSFATVLSFEFTGDRSGDPALRFVGRGFLDRQAFRYDYEKGNHPLFSEKMSIRSADGGKILAVIDGNAGTYFFRATEGMSGVMSNFRAPGQTGVEDVSVDLVTLGREESVDGVRFSRVRVTISYRILMELDGVPLSADVEGTAELVVAPKYRNPALPWGHQFALKTGWEEVDTKVADVVRKLGFPVEQRVTVTRTIEGGSEITETSDFKVTSFREVAFAAAGFSPPAGFRAMEPTLIGPTITDTGEGDTGVRNEIVDAAVPSRPAEAAPAAKQLPIEELDPGSAPPLFVETMEVRVVNVDVIVRDKKGNPVSGLTPEDFEILENGQPVEITNFLEMSSGTGEMTEAARSPTEADSASAAVSAPDESRRRRKIVLFFDQNALNPAHRKKLIPAIKRFIDEAMRPGDEVMIASLGKGFEIDLQLTSNRQVVQEMIGRMEDRLNASRSRGKHLADVQQSLWDHILDYEAMNEKPPYELGLSDCRAYADTVTHDTNSAIASLEAVMKALQGVDGRKILVYATESLPVRPGNEVFTFFDGIKQFFAGGERQQPIIESLSYDLTARVDALADTANQTGFTLYPIQAQSLSSGFASSETSGSMAVRFSQSAVGVDEMRKVSDAEGLQTVARLTGGVATLGANDFTMAFDNIAKDLEHYYSIGYRASGERSDFIRTIRVKMKNPDLVARTRRSHVDRSIETEMEEYVAANLFYPIERNDMGITTTASKPKPAGENVTLTLTVDVPTANLTLIPRDEEVFGSFTLFIGFVRADGSVSKIARDARQFKFPSATMSRRKSITMALEVTMDETTDRISVGVLDPISKATGFATTFVERDRSEVTGGS